MAKQEKEKRVEELKEILQGSQGILLTDFTGLNVANITLLRRRFREAQIQFQVVKNTLTSIAAKEAQVDSLLPYLSGPVAIAAIRDDPLKGIRILTDFAKENEKPKILGGLLWGEVYGPDEIERLSTLPSREVLIVQVAGVLKSPLLRFLYLMRSPLVRFMMNLKELEKLKSQKRNDLSVESKESGESMESSESKESGETGKSKESGESKESRES